MYFALRARLLKEKDNVFMICFHYEQLIGKVFERKTDKCCSILKSHCCNSKAHRVINLEIAKILKEKGFNDILPGQKITQAMCNGVWKEFWNFRVFNSICKRTEAKKVDTCTTFQEKKVKQWPKKQLILFMLSRMMNTADSSPGKRIM